MTERAGATAIAWRYALAVVCVSAAVVLRVSPLGPFFYPTEPFIFAVVAAAWLGGAGPGVLAALLSAVTVPQLIALTELPSAEYRLLWGFFDLPRFITLGLTGAAVGWGTRSLRRTQSALRERERELTTTRDALESAVAQRTAHLAESEERYARAMEATEAGHWEWDLVTHQVYHSPRFRELYGVAVDEEFPDREAWKARQPIPPSERARQEEALRASIADPAKPYDIELSFEVRPGEVRWVRSLGKVFRDENGRPLRISGATTDITAQKMAQEALRLSEERYARVMLAAEAGFWDWDVAADKFYVSPKLLEMTDFPPDTVFGGRTDFMARAPFHPDDRIKWEHALKELFASGGTRLAMEIRSIHVDETRWALLSGICARDAAGKVLRWTGSATDITARKHAEMALRQSEDRYARAMEGSDAGHWDWDLMSGEMFVSDRARELLALPAGSLPAKRDEIMALVPMPPEDREAMHEQVAAALVSGTHERDYRVIPRPGELRWLRSRGKVFRDATSKPVRMTGSLSDITERKLAAEALRESEERYALALEASEEGHFDNDLQTGEIFVSARVNEIYGFARQAEIWNRRDFLDRVPFHPDDRSRVLAALSKPDRQDPADLYEIECRITPHPGETRWIHSRAKVVRDAEGRPRRRVGVVADITERKLAEEALRLSEERYALAMRASGEGHWDWKIDSDEFYASPRYLEVGGFPPDMQYSRRADIVDRIAFHPDDRAKYEAAVAAHFAGETPRLDIVIRIVPNGEVRWLHVIGMCMRDADGKPVRWAGSVADITERKRAEALLAGEKQLLEMMARATPLATVLDGLCRIVEENLTGCLCGIGLVDATGTRLGNGAAPSLPPGYVQAIDDKAMHADAGPCCMAAVRGEQVISPDVGTETRWQGWRDLALSHGLRSIWSTPIVSSAKKALGTFAIYFMHPSNPTDEHLAIIERFSHVAAVAIERSHAEDALRLSEERYALAMEASEEGHLDWNVQTDEMFTSAHLKKVLDLPADAGYRTRSQALARMRFYPGDRERVAEMTRAVLAGSALQHEFEYRLVRGEGQEPRWIRAGWKIFRDAQGAAQRVIGVVSDVTEKKRFEEELRSRKEMLELALKSARAVPWQWINGADPQVNRWSPELAAMFGVQPSAFDGTAAGWWNLCHPDDMPKVKASIAQTFATGEIDVEYRVVHPDGKVHWLNQKGRAFFDANGKPVRSIGFMFDVTERRKVEDDLRSRQEMLDLAQKSARAIAFEWKIGEGEGENRWSADLEAMYGFAPGTYDGTFETWKTLVHPEDWPRVKEAIKHAQRTGEIASEYRVVHSDGSAHWLQARGRMFFDAAGNPSRMVGFMQDVTLRKQAEQDVRQLEQKLRRAQRLEAMGTLAGGIAHDFNNILGAIVGYGEMALRDAKKGTRLRRDLDAIMAAGERGRALVDRILAFSRSGVGERAPVHVEEVVREALDQLAAKLPENVTIAPRLHAGRAAMLGDSTQVHQVVMNLVNNAVQAMPKGGTLRVSLESVAISMPRAALIGSLPAGEYLVLKVSDSGAGIAPDVLERMFDPFFTTKEVGVGSGLGLSLVHGIVTNVGGAIDVATELGKGSTFTVYLPRSGDAPARTVDENQPLPRGEGERVLVVDDEELLVRLATETLERLGYAAVGFTSSAAALAAFRADPQRFDAVLTDERMPGMSGTALIREVRGIRDSIPVVLMSGYLGATPRDAREPGPADALGVLPRVAVGVGANVVVMKPLSARDLAASMARALRH